MLIVILGLVGNVDVCDEVCYEAGADLFNLLGV